MVHTKGGVIFDLVCAEDNCKYLIILECDMILLKEGKESVHKEYLAILQETLKESASYINNHVHRRIHHASNMVWVWCHTLDPGGTAGN